MQADIWEGDWGLPSVDVACLQAMTYAKFSGAPLKCTRTNNPWRSPTGLLPVVRHGAQVSCTKFDDILQHFRSQNYSADFQLDNKQISDVKAYISILDEKLHPALLYLWWLDSKNYLELTRPWYARVLPFPLNYFVPGNYQKKAQGKISAQFGMDDFENPQVETQIYKHAEECLTLLSNRLGEHEFFFGKSPTSLDATVFAYLAPLLKVPFPNPTLQNYLKACDNLVRFIVRILHRYFPLSPKELEEQKQKEFLDQKNREEESEFPNKRKNQLVCAVFALFAMFAYAVSSGVVQAGNLGNATYNDSGFRSVPELPDFLDQAGDEDDDDDDM